MTVEGAGAASGRREAQGAAGREGLDGAEAARFDALAADWWNPSGPLAPLHAMNPARLDWIGTRLAARFGRDRAAPCPFAGLRILDVGCGGGLLAEPLARLGAAVTGLDPAPAALEAARAHAAGAGLAIDYREGIAEDLARRGERFDAVVASEVIEHVPDPAAFLATLAALACPGGLVLLTTLNRTAKSFAAAILGAEWLLRLLPRGTHDWRRFLAPDELEALLRKAGLEPVDRMGLVFDPFRWDWRLSERDLAVNYAVAAARP
jgi:2-polyprenyl-6-hydroxyphenyl methylase/3-demethylubiquinone-9 3-methyltransferase